MTPKKVGVFLMAACFLLLTAGCRKEPEPKTYTPYDFDLASYIRLGDILGVSYIPLDTQVTEEEVTVRLCQAMEKAGLYDREDLAPYRQTGLTEGTVAWGDTILFSCTATVDGEPFPDGTAKDRRITVGEREVNLEGFDSGLVGLPLGTQQELTLRFPSDYADFSLRGQEILLTVRVTQIQQRLLCPDTLTQEDLALLTDLPDWNAYRVSLREELEEERERAAEEKKLADCWQAAVNTVTIVSYPQVEIEHYMETYRAYMEEQGKEAGFDTLASYLTHLGLTEEQLEQQGMTYARSDILQEMIVYAVARNEGFDKMSDEMFERYALPYATQLGLSSVTELVDVVGYDQVQKRVLTQVVKEYLAKNGKPVLPEEDPDGEMPDGEGDG